MALCLWLVSIPHTVIAGNVNLVLRVVNTSGKYSWYDQCYEELHVLLRAFYGVCVCARACVGFSCCYMDDDLLPHGWWWLKCVVVIYGSYTATLASWLLSSSLQHHPILVATECAKWLAWVCEPRHKILNLCRTLGPNKLWNYKPQTQP